MKHRIRLFRDFLRSHPDATFYSLLAATVVGSFFLAQAFKNQVILFTLSADYRAAQLETGTTNAQDFLTLSLGIIVEAFPFVVLGVAVSVVIQRFIRTERIIKRLPKHPIPRRLIISFLGIFMPVCECGNVAVARSLVIRGFKPQESIIFLLSAPSINLITIIVTLEAFNFEKSLAIVRVVGTLIVANLAALIVARLLSRKQILTDSFAATCKVESKNHSRSLTAAADLFRREMWLIMRMLVFGAMIAAATQTFIPRETLTAIGDNVILGVLAMLLLAFVISICSSVDAFFALAYSSTFSLGAIAAFLIAGPMVDIKMLALMRTTYTTRALVIISSVVLTGSFIIGVGLYYVY